MITFQTATLAEAEAITALVNSAYRGDSSKAGWTTEADLIGGTRTNLNDIRAMIETRDQQIELAYEGDSLVGSVFLKREKEDTLYFGMLTVKPTLQTRGLGKNLLNHVEALARQWACTQIRMTVIHLRTELIAFYERRGFKATGAAEPFHDNPAFGTPLVSGIKLLEFTKRLV